jgi:ubiquinone/menaquinone biosynthesis C-methylase UbiE
MRKINEKIIKFCPACLNSSYLKHTYGYDYEYKTSLNRWTIVSCKKCKLLYLKNRPHKSTLGIIYPKAYYSFNYNKISFIARSGKYYLDKLKFNKFLLKENKENFNFLDIGCGDGRYLELMHKNYKLKKSNCYGIDFKNDKLNELKKEGYTINFQEFEKFRPKKKFDVITMFHVIEHVISPTKYLEKIYNLLKKDGILVLETPNCDSLDARLFKKNYWGGYHIPRHFVVFNDTNLVMFAERMKFNLVKKIFLTGHYFWMMSFYNKLINKHGFLKKFFDPFNILGLPLLILFTIFDILRNNIGFKTSTVLVVLKKNHLNLIPDIPLKIDSL